MNIRIPPLTIPEIPTYRIGEASAHISKTIMSDLGFESQVIARVLISLRYTQADIHNVNLSSLFILSQENFDAVIVLIYYMKKHDKTPIDMYGKEFMEQTMKIYSLYDHKMVDILSGASFNGEF